MRKQQKGKKKWPKIRGRLFRRHRLEGENMWGFSVTSAEAPGKTLRFQDKRIPLYLGVRLRLASDSKYLKRSLTRWGGVRESKLQNRGQARSPELRNIVLLYLLNFCSVQSLSHSKEPSNADRCCLQPNYCGSKVFAASLSLLDKKKKNKKKNECSWGYREVQQWTSCWNST